MQSVLGEICEPPANLEKPYRISADGELMILPGTGGITYNARIGDSAIDWVCDHVEPAVSIKSPVKPETSSANAALQIFSCVGNRAIVVSGEAKGEWGRVTGTHGGVEHVMIDFTREQMDKMVIGDRIQIRAFGQGLSLVDFPGIKVMNIDPALLDVMGILGSPRIGRIKIPVTHLVPAATMGSGLGKVHTYAGDYDIQMFDEPMVKECKLNSLRFGDIVAIVGADNTYGRVFRQKSITVGVIVHSRSIVAGHGPGVATLFTSKEGLIDPVININANLKNYFAKM